MAEPAARWRVTWSTRHASAGAKATHEVASGAGLTNVVAMREGWRPEQALQARNEAAWAEGQAMTLHQAIDYALAREGRITAAG